MLQMKVIWDISWESYVEKQKSLHVSIQVTEQSIIVTFVVSIYSDEAGLNEINYYPADENDTTCVYLAPKGHDFENVIDEAYLKNAATCSKPAVYYSKCKDCGAKGNTFESDIYTPHTLKYVPKKEATCTKNGNEEYWQCTECRHVFDSDIG